MTREVAIDNLKADIKYWENTSVSTEHLYMAIKALEQEPIYYPPCQDCHTKMDEIVHAYDNVKSLDDAISRQVVKEQMLKYGFHAPDMTATEFVEDLPPVLPKREKSKRKSMTNQEKLSAITAEEFFDKIMWLLHEYGKRYSNSKLAITEWLQAESEEKA